MRDLHICLRIAGSLEWVGDKIYIQNLAWAIANLPEKEKRGIRLSISSPITHAEFAEPIRASVDHVYEEHFAQLAYAKLAKILAEHIRFIPRRLLNPRRFDFVYPDLAGARAPYVWGGWMADFQHRHLPELFSPKEIDYRDKICKKMADNAPVIILSSRMAQEDFCSIFPEAAHRSALLNFVSWIDPEWFHENPKAYQEKYGIKDDFFLLANQFWKHKDHRVVIDALGLLKQQGIAPTVVCTGSTRDYRHPDYFKELMARIQQLSLDSQVRILGFIPRRDQVQLMRRSLSVIQPSRFEGWSTVVEEARLLGKTILLSDFPVHLEQNPPNSSFFESGNAEDLASLMAKVSSSGGSTPDLEKEKIARLDNMSRLKIFGSNFLQIVRRAISR
jgi:glycosyltransferase involved in cell wall biosynthesis